MSSKKSALGSPQSQDSSGSAANPTPRINLKTMQDVAREMGRVYRDVRCKRIPSQEGTRLTYMLGELIKVYQAVLLEKRVAQLEELTNEQPQ